MNLEPDTDTPVHMRLDDIFRLLLHDRTMETLRLLLPDLSLPESPRRPVRLDTQSPLTQLLVDAAYLVRGRRGPLLLLIEGQSRASQWREERPAALLHASIAQLAPKPLLVGIRLMEARLLERALPQSPALPTGSPEFATTNVLLDVDPESPPFTEPEHWVFAAFSRRVDARWIATKALEHRAIALANPGRGLFPSDRLLLGLCGRARFPDSIECRQAVEELMNEATKAAKIASPASNLTVEERHHLEVSILEAGREAARLRREKEEGHLITGRAELERDRQEFERQRQELERQRQELQQATQEVQLAKQEVQLTQQEVQRELDELRQERARLLRGDGEAER